MVNTVELEVGECSIWKLYLLTFKYIMFILICINVIFISVNSVLVYICIYVPVTDAFIEFGFRTEASQTS